MPYKNTLLLFIVFTCSTSAVIFGQYAEEDWAARDEWMNVPDLIELLAVDIGDEVADIGCHEGYFSFHLSEKVGDNGKVYAVDVAEYRIDALKEHIKNKKVRNITPILGEYDNPKLPVTSLNAVMLMDTYHEIEAHRTVLSHIKNALKSNGRLLVLEKLKKHAIGKSRKEQVTAHTLSANFVRKELEEAGFKILEYVDDFGNWKNESDKQMWILVATPQNN